MMQEVTIGTEWIKLEALLKLAGWCDTGGQAKVCIQGGEIAYNGAVCRQRGKKCRDGDVIAMDGRTLTLHVREAAAP